MGFVRRRASVRAPALWTRCLKRENWAVRRRVSLSEEDEEGEEEGEEGGVGSGIFLLVFADGEEAVLRHWGFTLGFDEHFVVVVVGFVWFESWHFR